MYLKNPAVFTRLGGKLPTGLMLTGPPGTGEERELDRRLHLCYESIYAPRHTGKFDNFSFIRPCQSIRKKESASQSGSWCTG